MTAPCRVCELLDGDHTPKAVLYCSLCDAWMCDRCRGAWGRRVLAAFIDKTKGSAHAPADR